MPSSLLAAAIAAATVGSYLLACRLYRRHPRWYTSPLLTTWAMGWILTLVLHLNYRTYLQGTQWLLTLLGPAVVAFAIPIYEQRQLIRKYWQILALGVLTGSALAFATSWLLAWALGLAPELRLSLLPRSITTPFALAFGQKVGGLPELIATFVVITGLLGASLGELLLTWLPLRSAFARGALLGMGAHSLGTVRARELGALEGSVAGLVMVLAGLFSVLVAPLFAFLCR